MSKPRSANKNDKTPVDRVIVQVQLEGDEAARFEAYKKREIIDISSVAGKKLMLERLAQLETAASLAR